MAGSGDGSLLVVGKITGCFGVRGWLKVQSYTDPPENLLDYTQLYLKRREEFEPLELDEGRTHGKGLVIHIAGVDDRTLAESFRGAEIAVPESALPRLDAGEYYWRDLQGLQVWCRDGSESNDSNDRVLLGTVDYLIETGANDVLVVKPGAGSIDERERLIPYLPGSTVTRVDTEEGVIEVDWFLDEE